MPLSMPVGFWECVDSMKARIGQRTNHRCKPNTDDHTLGMGTCDHTFCPEWVHNSNVALYAECRHVQHRGKTHRLKEEGFKVAATLPKQEGVVTPQFIQLQGHAKDEHQQVRHGQAEQVEVGGCAHDWVACDHSTGESVPHSSHAEDQQVSDAHGQEHRGAPRTQVLLQVIIQTQAVIFHLYFSQVQWKGGVAQELLVTALYCR